MFNKLVPLSEITETLAKYSLSSVLDLLSKIDVFLTILPLEKDPQTFGTTDFNISDAVLCDSAKQRINRKLKQDIKQKSPEKSVIWTRGQLLFLKKLALLYCSSDDGDNIYKDLQTVEVTKLFLGATDYFHKASDTVDVDSSIEAFYSYCVKQHYLERQCNPKNLLSRTYLMTTKFDPSKEKTASYLLGSVGIDLTSLLIIGWRVLIPCLQTPEKLRNRSMIFDLDNEFRQTKIDPEIAKTFLNLLAISEMELRAKLKEQMKDGDPLNINFHDNNVFTETPLLRLRNGKYCVMDITSFIEKITFNFNWITGKFDPKLQELKGAAFDKYVRYRLEKYCDGFEHLEFTYIDDYGKSNEELGDAIVIDKYNKRLFIFEAKSRQFDKKIQLAGILEDVLVEICACARQLDQSIEKLEKYKILDMEFDEIYPIVVCYEQIPTDMKLMNSYRERVANGGFFQNPKIHPLEIATILILEAITASGDDISEMLYAKHNSTQEALEAGLHNYICSHGKAVKEELLQDAFDELADLAKKSLLPTS